MNSAPYKSVESLQAAPKQFEGEVKGNQPISKFEDTRTYVTAVDQAKANFVIGHQAMKQVNISPYNPSTWFNSMAGQTALNQPANKGYEQSGTTTSQNQTISEAYRGEIDYAQKTA